MSTTKSENQVSTKTFRPGRIYTVVYVSDVDMVGKRKFDGASEWTHNPMGECAVSVRRKSVVQAAGDKTWANYNLKKNPNWTPSMDAVAWWAPLDENRCFIEHKQNATVYLRGLPKGIIAEEYTVDGQPATAEQIETIRKFKKNLNEDKAEFVTLSLHKLENVLDETGEDE